MVFDKPTGLHTYPYEGDMVSFNTERTDVLVTPDHKMWVNRADGVGKRRKWSKVVASALLKDTIIRFKSGTGWDNNFELDTFEVQPHNSECVDRDAQPTTFDADTFLEFLGYYLSEGGTGIYATTPKSRNKTHTIVHVGQKAGDKANQIGLCIDKLGLKYNVHHSKSDGCLRWHIHHYGLHTLLKNEYGMNHLNKHIPDHIRNLSIRQLGILFDALMLGDGFWDKRENRTSGLYYTTSSLLADDIQEIALKLGYSSTVKIMHDKRGGNRSTEYRVYVRKGKDFQVTKRGVTIVPYSGVVYCFSTTTGLFFTRRNGKVAIQGNTAENLLELIQLSTDKERDAWRGGYTELGQKAIVMYNEKFNQNLKPEACEFTIPFSSSATLSYIEKVYLPMFMAGAMSLEQLLSYLTNVDVDKETLRIKEAEKAKQELEQKQLREQKELDVANQSRVTGNGGSGVGRNGQPASNGRPAGQ